MNSFIIFLLILLSTIVTQAGTKKGKIGTFEPNDTPKQAIPLEINSITTTEILSSTDRDFFILKTTQPETVLLKLEGRVVDTFSPQVVIYQGGKKKLKFSSPVTGAKLSKLFNVSQDMPLLIEVLPSEWSFLQKMPLDYKLTIASIGSKDVYEPNSSSRETAPIIEFGQKIDASIYPEGDVDFYRIKNISTFTQLAMVYINASLPEEYPEKEAELILNIYSKLLPGEQVIRKIYILPKQTVRYRHKLVFRAEDELLIRLTSVGILNYELKIINFTYEEDTYKNDIFNASLILLNETVTGSCYPLYDKDFLKIYNSSKNKNPLRLILRNLSKDIFLPRVVLYNKDKEIIEEAHAREVGADIGLDISADAESLYYIKVESSPADINTVGEYNLLIYSIAGKEDKYEPNFSDEVAKPIKVDEKIYANFHYKDDIDYYKVELKEGNLFINLENEGADSLPVVEIYDRGGILIVENKVSTKGANLRFSVNIPYSSTYYVKVSQRGDFKEEKIESPYTLVLYQKNQKK